ncbi:MAG: mycothiol synthase [Nocardioides sp.]
MSAVRVTATSYDEALAVVDAVRAVCRAGDGVDPLDEAADLQLKHRGLDGASLWVVGDAGFALLRGTALDLAVAPAVRRAGYGRSLAGAALADAPTHVDAWSHGDSPGAAALAAEVGFKKARELWVLRRPSAGVAEPGPVERVTIRSYRPGDETELLRVNAAAFANHPEQGSMDAADLAERMAEPWFDPAGLLVAEDEEGGLLGFHWTKQHSADLGEVYVVGIDPAAQGRGLGRTLTAAGLTHLAGLGVADIELYVESDNAPAVSMYERLGFTHTATHVRYARSG